MHHHGRDGECHSGPDGMFGCDRCDLDRYREDEARMEAEAEAEAIRAENGR